MAELSDITDPEACCDSSALATCCDPDEKEECCSPRCTCT